MLLQGKDGFDPKEAFYFKNSEKKKKKKKKEKKKVDVPQVK